MISESGAFGDRIMKTGIVVAALVSYFFAASVTEAAQGIGADQTSGSVKATTIPASPNISKRFSHLRHKAPKDYMKAKYIGPCGGSYACSNGEVIICGGLGRPYEGDDGCYCYADPVCRH
jgi:hypothetical protein